MTTPPPYGTVIGKPIPQTPPDPTAALQLQMKMLQQQQKYMQSQIANMQKQAARLKGKTDARDKAALNNLNHQIDKTNANLTQAGVKLAGLQNKYYEQTGQYDKLLSGTNRDAFMALQALFKNYGLESLAGKIYDYVKNGYSSDTISILLQDTPEYKQRFVANQARIKAGLPALSPADYINTENSYRQVLRTAGLPSGFYDQTSDFTQFLTGDISPTELQSRADLANQAVNLSDPAYRQALNAMGIDNGHMAAYFLDPQKSLPLLQKAAATAAIGGAALRQGLTFDQGFAAQLAATGVSAAQAQQGYSAVAQQLGTLHNLGSIYGQQYGQSEAQQAEFGTSAAAVAERQGLIGAEKGAFSGPSGTAAQGLSQSKTPTSLG